MRARFDFQATAHPRTPYADVAEALASLEQAKTALRAMRKYVPSIWCGRLYEAGREPELGGEPCELTVMFTDIADFTTVARRCRRTPSRTPWVLPRGHAGVLAAHGGTVDKYIARGDGAVERAAAVADHATRAGRAALACVAALEELYASESGAACPASKTASGLHTDTVLVWHFGAPDRLSFTAPVDGVNLASRWRG